MQDLLRLESIRGELLPFDDGSRFIILMLAYHSLIRQYLFIFELGQFLLEDGPISGYLEVHLFDHHVDPLHLQLLFPPPVLSLPL